jgi:fatty acid synthase
MLSSLVQWDHSDTWELPTVEQFTNLANGLSGTALDETFEINVSPGSEDEYLSGHVIDGRLICPVAAYLVMIWKQLARIQKKKFDESHVIFEDVDILGATMLQLNGII